MKKYNNRSSYYSAYLFSGELVAIFTMKRLRLSISIEMNIFRRWRGEILSLASAGNKQAQFQASDSAIIAVLTQYHVKASYRHKFAEVLAAYVFSSLRAAGNIMAEASYEQGDPSIMWLMERWSSQDFYNRNRKSDAAKVVTALTKIGLVSPMETILINDLELLSRETPAAGNHLLAIMLFLDLKKGTEEGFRLINHGVISAFRDEPGFLFFQLSQIADHKRRFIVYKKFRDREAFQHHLKNAAIEPLMKFLQTAVKKPPFEREYHQLIEIAPLHKQHWPSDRI